MILIVDDNPDILAYMKGVLEHNECSVLTAKNGKNALDGLEKSEEVPDLIISDIMMPKMDGYDFFIALSEQPVYCRIPFIFLTALDKPEDIRLGKLLGADDYFTKPVDEDTLLATIAGKILRNMKNEKINMELNKFLMESKESFKSSLPKKDREKIILLEVEWDDRMGPQTTNSYPETPNQEFLESLGSQLYVAASTIYGSGDFSKAEGAYISIENFGMDGYALFDSYTDKSFRGGHKEYMFAVVAPKISYLHTLKIKKVLQELSNKTKDRQNLDFKKNWKALSDIITHTPL